MDLEKTLNSVWLQGALLVGSLALLGTCLYFHDRKEEKTLNSQVAIVADLDKNGALSEFEKTRLCDEIGVEYHPGTFSVDSLPRQKLVDYLKSRGIKSNYHSGFPRLND